MDSIASEEKAKYEKVWDEIPEYCNYCAADYLTPVFLTYFHAQIAPDQRVIDFGCGAGRSSYYLTNLKVDLVDFASNCLETESFLLSTAPHSNVRFWEACLWDLPKELLPAKWGVCFDVLEHIPTEKVALVLSQMASRITCGALFGIDLEKDRMGEKVGESLHLTIMPAAWWKEQLARYFQIQEVLLEDNQKLVVALLPRS